MYLRVIIYLFILGLYVASAPATVAIITHQQLPQYTEAISVIKNELAPHYTIRILNVTNTNAHAISSDLKENKPSAIISVGTKATKLIAPHISTIPIIFTMVYQPVQTSLVASIDRPEKNITGVALDIPLALQFKTLRKIFPYIRRIGALYTPYIDKEMINQATTIANNHDFRLISEPVYSKAHIQPAMHSLFKQQIQLLWSTPDQTIYSQTSLPYILLSLNRFRVPFIGISESYLTLGAYISFRVSPSHIGKKTADMAHAIITNNQWPMQPPIMFPDTIEFSVNQTVMNDLGFRMPPSILDSAYHVITP